MFGRSGSPNINSYYASIGTTTYIDADCVNPGTTTGVFGYRVAYGLRDINDGSSNTIAFSESVCSSGQSTATFGQLIMGAGYTADQVYDVNSLGWAFLVAGGGGLSKRVRDRQHFQYARPLLGRRQLGSNDF